MKTHQIRTILTLLVMVFAFSAAAQKTQQSAIYDAIALMNANHSINVIMMPDAAGYYTIDPITGTRGSGGQITALDQSLKNSAISKEMIKKILKRNANLSDEATDQELKAAYKDNPFLKSFTLPNDSLRLQPFDSKVLSDGIKKFDVAPLSGAAPVNILKNAANGTADFLIKRANDELTVAAIQRLKTFTAHYPEFGVLFPRTISLIKPVAAYDYAKTLNALKTTLKEDLDQLPLRLPQLYAIPRYQSLNDKAPVLTLIFSASEMLNALHGDKKLSKSIHDLDSCQFLSAKNNYASFVRVMVLASDNLRKKTQEETEEKDFDYISLDEINKVTNNSISNKAELATYFLGLLYQRGQNIPFYTSTGTKTISHLLHSWSASSNGDLAALLEKISKTAINIQQLNIQLTALKNNDEASTQIHGKPFWSFERFNTYNKLVISAVQLCEPFMAGADIATPSKQEFLRMSTYYPTFSGHTTNMIKALSQKDYSLAVDDLSQMLAVVTRYLEQRHDDEVSRNTIAATKASATTDVANLEKEISATESKISALAKVEPTTTPAQTAIESEREYLLRTKNELHTKLTESKWQKNNAEKFVFAFAKIVDYYKLFAALSQAENGKEVETLLETFALPSGSSRIKKVTDFSIAVNAYVGGFFARTKTVASGFSNEYGLTAPIGFTISHGFNKAGSLSLFAGVFDIGGIIRYKLDNAGAYQQDVNLAGLVSPSVHFAYGLPFYMPLSLGAGYQFTSPISTSTNSFNFTPHFNLFLAVDIPMFNLTASRKK